MEQEKVVIERATTPRGELQLQQRFLPTEERPVYEIIFNGIFLMASYNQRSERSLATLAIEPLKSARHNLEILIGGLGMGYTLRAALDFQDVQSVDVVEIEEHIIRWAKGPFRGLNGNACFDSRVHLIEMDLGDYLLSTEKAYDAIILDVDNGPTWLALGSNRRLYQMPALIKIRDLLRGSGIFTVWAAEQSEAFEKTLQQAFASVELITVRDRDRRARRIDYFIYRCRSPHSPLA
jgi:spermidine synthase